MADDKKPSGDKPAPATTDPFAEMVWTILAILLLMYALSGVTSFFKQSKLFSLGWKSLTPKGLVLSSTRPISSLLNPIGAKFVVTSDKADLFDSPGGKKIGTKELGDRGTIIGGPVTVGGQKYWQVRFEDGDTGWIAEKDIAHIPQKITPMKNMATLVGSPVETNKETAVFAEPGKNQIATMPLGSKATILEGPIIVDGVKYWHVRFEDGTEGWVAEDSLDSLLNGERKPLSKMPSLLGGTVATNKNGTPIYDRPGGIQIGTLNKGISGKIIEGPLVLDGVKYWHVRFEDGTEGWVSENDLDYVEDIEPNFFVKTLILFWKFVSYLKYIVILLSLIMIGWVVYLYKGVVRLRIAEGEKLYPKGIPKEFSEKKISNGHWDRILDHLNSENENDWRHAIIEADIMLSELIDKLSLPGETMGDKMKAIEKADFTTIDSAWEAHKIRNQIAHEGSTFMLNKKEAKRVVDLYREVFEEFNMI